MIQLNSTFDIKTFIFENQITCQSENQDVSIPSNSEEFDIRHIIDSFKEKNTIFMPLEWKIYDPKLHNFKIIDVEKPLLKLYLYSPIIMFKYREIALPDSDCDSINSKGSSESKKERNKQRSIRQVIQYVKQWRQIHNSLDKYKNKVNLYDAAKKVGIAKKSLDDYFCQLRLAQQYGFNFFQNLDKKIGFLRAFVRKNRKNKQQSSSKYQRVPKKLKIIQQFPSVLSSPVQQFKQKQFKQKLMQEQPLISVMQMQYQPPMQIIPEQQLQNRFLSSFNYMTDDPTEQYIDFGLRHNPQHFGGFQGMQFLFF